MTLQRSQVRALSGPHKKYNKVSGRSFPISIGIPMAATIGAIGKAYSFQFRYDLNSGRSFPISIGIPMAATIGAIGKAYSFQFRYDLNSGRSSIGRALPCHGRGCGFESRRSRS